MKKIFIALCLLLAFSATVANAAKPKAKHVVLIGIDGWGAYSVPKADIPNIKGLMNEGCYTLKHRSVLPSSSAVNWSSMFMGLPTELHGYTNWNSQKPEIPSRTENSHHISPTIYSVIREQNPKAETGFFYEWDGLTYLVDTLAISHVEGTPDFDKQQDLLFDHAVKYIKEKKPLFVSVCCDQVDEVGHGVGHDTPAYYAQLNKVDKNVGRIIQALKDAGIYDDTVIIFTADHGGINKGHGGKTLQEMQIPFIIAGKGIKKGGEIKDITMQYDTPATIAYILGMKTPDFWRGHPILSVFK